VVWRQVQHTRQRDAVYEFLETVYDVVSRFNRAGDGRKLLRKLHRLDHRLKRIQESYSAVIHYATGYTVDNRTRSKWSRLMRLEAFADAAAGRAPYPITHQEMVDTIAALEAIGKSSESGAIVPVVGAEKSSPISRSQLRGVPVGN